MSLQFIIGRAGCGKSRILYEKMIEASRSNPDKNYVAIVPEQYSMETQKEILSMHPNGGSFNIEVTSMVRLARTVLDREGVTGFKLMDELGKTLVMRKVLEECKGKLSIYKDKTSMPGVSEKMKDMVTEFQQYAIGTGEIEKIRDDVKDKPALRQKFDDFSIIYEAFKRYMDEKVVTAEEILDIFCEHAGDFEYLKNTYFFFDGFMGFTPSQYRVIGVLLRYAPQVVVTVLLPFEEMKTAARSSYNLFYPSMEIFNDIKGLAESYNVPVEDIVVAGESNAPYRIKDNPELCFIEKHIFRENDAEKYSGECENVSIHKAKGPREEASYVVSRIDYLIKEKGYRYNDIAVLTGDMDNYYRYLEKDFEKRNISAFIDHKSDILSNPFVDFILSAILVVEKNFSYESVMHLLRLDIFDISRGDIDLFDNYLIRSGKRGHKSYEQKWEKQYKHMDGDELAIVNNVRSSIFNVWSSLKKLNNNDQSVSEMTIVLYEFLEEIKFESKIDKMTKEFMDKGMARLSNEYSQMYEAVLSVFERMESLLGKEKIKITEYRQILQSGFECTKIGTIPPGLDTVMVGDIERTRLKDTKKIIFFIGVNDGVIPKESEKGGLITDREREFLEDRDHKFSPTKKENVFRQRLYLYSLMAKPTQQLRISFRGEDADKKTRRKSYLIGTVKGMFEDLEIKDITQENRDLCYMTDRKEALEYIAEHESKNIGASGKGNEDKKYLMLYRMLSCDDKSKWAFEKIKEGRDYRGSRKWTGLKESTARKLYGIEDNIKATSLEKYASCAYRQFLENGLFLKEREKYEVAPFDLGNLYHDALERYFEIVRKKDVAWEDIDENMSNEMMSESIDAAVEDYENDALFGTAKNQFLKEQIKEVAIDAADVLLRHIKSGEFYPEEYEFTLNGGRIDRLDLYEKDGKVYVKVIDYKTTGKNFIYGEVMSGLSMQLLLYLKNAVEYESKKNPDKQVLPAGGMYFTINPLYTDKPNYTKELESYHAAHPNTQKSDEEILDDIVKQERYKEYKMDGIVTSDIEILGKMDLPWSELGKYSSIIPVGKNSDGIYKNSEKAMDEKHFVKLMDYVYNLSGKMRKEIISGNIAVNPTKDACDKCSYKSVCRFDKSLGDSYRKIEKCGREDVKEILDSKENPRGTEAGPENTEKKEI